MRVCRPVGGHGSFHLDPVVPWARLRRDRGAPFDLPLGVCREIRSRHTPSLAEGEDRRANASRLGGGAPKKSRLFRGGGLEQTPEEASSEEPVAVRGTSSDRLLAPHAPSGCSAKVGQYLGTGGVVTPSGAIPSSGEMLTDRNDGEHRCLETPKGGRLRQRRAASWRALPGFARVDRDAVPESVESHLLR